MNYYFNRNIKLKISVNKKKTLNLNIRIQIHTAFYNNQQKQQRPLVEIKLTNLSKKMIIIFK